MPKPSPIRANPSSIPRSTPNSNSWLSEEAPSLWFEANAMFIRLSGSELTLH